MDSNYWLSESELKEVNEILKSGNLVQGEEVEKFENEFAEFVGSSYAISVNSGTAGLHTALSALNHNSSGNIITTPLSFAATSNSILYEKLEPFFVDVKKSSMNIDPDEIKKNIDKNTRGVIGVHLYGFPFDVHETKKICDENNLFLIEDCAQSLGAKLDGKFTGTFSDAGVFSFYDTKHLRLGEGGMIVTNNKKTYEKCKLIRSHGMSRQYVHEMIGYNYRMNEIFAKIGRIQLKKASSLLHARIEHAKIYSDTLQNISNISIPDIPSNIIHTFYKFPIILKNNLLRGDFLSKINENKDLIQTGYGMPIYKQPSYTNLSNSPLYETSKQDYNNLVCPNTEYLVENLIELPTDPWIPASTIHEISDSIRKACNDI